MLITWSHASPNPSWHSPAACTTEQYSFSTTDGWTINVPTTFAGGKAPYRAFAYLPLCDGQAISSCWGGNVPRTLAFRFKTERFAGWSAYSKLLFWQDGNNLLGLLPPTTSQAQAAGLTGVTLIAFPSDDLPQTWQAAMPLTENTYYDVTVSFTPGATGTAVSISVAGAPLASGTMALNILNDNNGPQLGVYSFDNQGATGTSDSFDLHLQEVCLGPPNTGASCLAAVGPGAGDGGEGGNPGGGGAAGNAPDGGGAAYVGVQAGGGSSGGSGTGERAGQGGTRVSKLQRQAHRKRMPCYAAPYSTRRLNVLSFPRRLNFSQG